MVKHSSTAKSAVRTLSLVPGTRTRHIVACGSVNHTNLKARLQELFHADHGMHNVRWVRVSCLVVVVVVDVIVVVEVVVLLSWWVGVKKNKRASNTFECHRVLFCWRFVLLS